MTDEVDTIKFIPETPPEAENAGRLGRHQQYDPRNENHRVGLVMALRPPGALPDRVWSRRLGVLDQGNIGACTAYALTGVSRTKPISGTLSSRNRRRLTDPLGLYELLTQNDPFPGTYPPDDTGSSVLAAMQLAKSLDIIKFYKWAMTPEEAATALSLVGAGNLGTNWMSGMDRPDDKGVVHPSGYIRGGHAYEAVGRIWDVDRWYWICINSWGPSWPAKPALGKPGHFAIPEEEVFGLIEADGEFAIPLTSA